MKNNLTINRCVCAIGEICTILIASLSAVSPTISGVILLSGELAGIRSLTNFKQMVFKYA